MSESDPNAATIPGATAAPPSAEERQWAMFAHLSSLLGGLLTSGWAFSAGFFIGPLIIWLMKKETMPFVDDQGKEALNFAITVSIICVALMIMTIMTFGLGALLTIPLLMAIGITSLVFVIIAAVKANEGVRYRYPVSIRLVK
jgi:uncharacterized Tic20 family protein